MRKLSIHYGYAPTLVRQALDKPYPNAERIIAEALGVSPETIWPSRYDDRRPLRGVGGAPTHNPGSKRPRKLSENQQNKSTTRSSSINVNIEGGE